MSADTPISSQHEPVCGRYEDKDRSDGCCANCGHEEARHLASKHNTLRQIADVLESEGSKAYPAHLHDAADEIQRLRETIERTRKRLEEIVTPWIGVSADIIPREVRACVPLVNDLHLEKVGLSVETSVSREQHISTAPKNGNFLVCLDICPELWWPAHRTDGGSIYSNAHGVLNEHYLGRTTAATYWRPMPPQPGSPEKTSPRREYRAKDCICEQQFDLTVPGGHHNRACPLRDPNYSQKATTSQAAIDANALADAHRMYEAEHGEPFQSNGKTEPT